MELRRKNKPAPAEIKPPSDPEEWIARANADGKPLQAETAPNKPARRSTIKAKRQQPEPQARQDKQEQREQLEQILPPTPTPSAGSRYISFAIDNVTLALFRELSFRFDLGNAGTLAHVIRTCAAMDDQEFANFPESRLVCGNIKRTMSFLLPQDAIDTVSALANRLRIRNKSALYRYLIHLLSRSIGISVQV